MTNLILAFIFPALFHSDTAIVTLKPKSMHTIYLTFDGGPVNSNKKVNALILNECVRATVFLKGSNVWEHNTHIGDARAITMSAQGMVNVGSLLNEQHGNKVYAIGLGSNEGTVVAGHKWGGMMSVIHLPEAVPGSWEHLMHGLGAGDRIVFMNEEMKRTFCKIAYGHRAIGVVYDPKHERHGNYVPSVMPMRYNAFIYIGHSQALHPPHIQPVGHQMPETYPFGL